MDARYCFPRTMGYLMVYKLLVQTCNCTVKNNVECLRASFRYARKRRIIELFLSRAVQHIYLMKNVDNFLLPIFGYIDRYSKKRYFKSFIGRNLMSMSEDYGYGTFLMFGINIQVVNISMNICGYRKQHFFSIFSS